MIRKWMLNLLAAMATSFVGVQVSAEDVDLIGEKHWAYLMPRRHPVPRVEETDWTINWIDRFILSRLEREGIQPSPDADRVTLVRRLFFDLTGLPPSPEDVEQFVDNYDDMNYAQCVDRLLASERFGERMAMYWFDLVRYADTVGYHGDQTHSSSPYRDYVIDSFNANLPFDQFTREQLAGDLLPDSGIDQKIASAYNRILQTSHEGGVQPKEYLAMYASDRIRNLSAVWMGATMGCSECHDHKYDPFTMKDFYSMQAFFADLDEAKHLYKKDVLRPLDGLPTARDPEIQVLTRRERQRIADLEERIEQLETELADIQPEDATKIAAIQAQIAQTAASCQAIRDSKRWVMVSLAVEPRTIRILPRGSWLDESGPVVTPAIPEFLGRLDLGDRRATRLDLASWLTDPSAGIGALTARVMVNRFVYLMFGIGIARDLNDFGKQGEAPTYPELLDNLAIEFVDNGWDVKRLIKQLVMSRTYRQSSLVSDSLQQRDPYNRLLARQSRFRLPAEMIRDNALAISGLLVLECGGDSLRPYQPAGYYRHLNFPKRTYQAHSDARQWRRGVYMHWQRQFLHPMLRAFDAPRREECAAQRTRSNTPVAVLVLLNDPTFVEAARVFAERILRDGGETTEPRLEFAYRRAVSRAPSDAERALLRQLLDANRTEYDANPLAAEQLISVGQAPVAQDLREVELAAWTGVARAILSMNETLTRN